MRPVNNGNAANTNDIRLHHKQGLAFESKAEEILFGGAAGGGKSHLLRVTAIAAALSIPGCQIYLFRRTHPDLIKNHLNGPGSFYELLTPYIQSKQVTITQNPLQIKFWTGSIIHLCHCQYDKDVYDYQGSEIHLLLLDEATLFTEFQYRFLRSRVRLGGLKIPSDCKITLPRIVCGSNPGNIGHSWVKRTFVDFATPFEIKRADALDGGLLRQFIPSKLEDNPTMMNNDPNYIQRLHGLGSPELVKAMMEGSWDITAGSALERLTRERCMIRNFTVPDHFTKFTVIDWGSYRPFAVCWFCVCDEDMVLKSSGHWPEKLIPKNSMILYREWYGWNGKDNEGCRMESQDVARRIIEIEEESGEKIDYRVGDSAMWAKTDGPSVQEKMWRATNGLYRMRQSIKDRANNYSELRSYIQGEDDTPFLYAVESALHFWRTVPVLQLDHLHPEKGPDTTQEDHIYDCCSYAVASRPLPMTKRQRTRIEYEEAKRKAEGTKGHYTTS